MKPDWEELGDKLKHVDIETISIIFYFTSRFAFSIFPPSGFRHETASQWYLLASGSRFGF